MLKITSNLYHVFLRRRQRLHLMTIQRPTYIHSQASFHFHKGIKIGKYCRIGNNCHIDGEGGVTIGDGSIFAPHVTILSSSHDHKQTDFLPYNNQDILRPVVIGRGCWLGWGAMVVPGVTIGDGAVVAMGSVVTKDVPAGAVVGGNPATILSERDGFFIQKAVEEERYYLKAVLAGSLSRKGRKSSLDMEQHLLK